MAYRRLKITTQPGIPWAKITDLDTGEEIHNAKLVELRFDEFGPVVRNDLIAELEVETDHGVVAYVKQHRDGTFSSISGPVVEA